MSLDMYDHLPPMEAALAAWIYHGPQEWHHWAMQQKVRRNMPLLARALDRAEDEQREQR